MLGQVVGEVGALDVLHDEVEVVAVAARVVHGDQAGVVDLRGDAALADEAAAHLLRVGRAGHPVGAQQFDADAAVEAAVVGDPDLAHAALAEQRGEFVALGDDASVQRPSSLRR